MIKLEEITPDNWRIDLKVSQEQEEYVANRTVLLARAYAYKNERSKAFLIYNDDTPIGMSLYYDLPEMNAYDFNQFFIDEKYQKKGYGTEATRLILDEMRKDGKYNKVILCYIKDNIGAFSLYKNVVLH